MWWVAWACARTTRTTLTTSVLSCGKGATQWLTSTTLSARPRTCTSSSRLASTTAERSSATRTRRRAISTLSCLCPSRGSDRDASSFANRSWNMAGVTDPGHVQRQKPIWLPSKSTRAGNRFEEAHYLHPEQRRWHRLSFPELALIDRTSAAFGDLSDVFVEDVSQISASDSFTVLRANKIMGQFSNAAILSDFQPSPP